MVIVIIVALVFVFAKAKRVSPLSWGHKAVNTPMFSNQAINGYDPVAYFETGKAIAGDENFVYQWNDADWYFSSQQNMDLFAGSPTQYMPQFGGYCSFAVSKGFTANSDPNSFEIIDGKLYFFADGNVQEDWKADINGNLKICKDNWN